MSLSNKALLVNLHISQWTGRKLDRQATSHVETRFATKSKVGQYTKKLLPGAAALDEVTRVASSLRQWYYVQTLPWYADGSRILSSKNYLDFCNEYRRRAGEFHNVVNQFMIEYPTLQQAAKQQLGDLFHETEYPSMGQLKHSFSCDIVFLPLPDVADFRTEMLDEEKKAFMERMRSVEEGATRECWNRLHDVVQKAVAKLQQPDAVFRDTLIDNIRETCALLPKLNVSDNPDLEMLRQAVESSLAGISADTLRSTVHTRANVADKLADITSRMGAFMGGV